MVQLGTMFKKTWSRCWQFRLFVVGLTVLGLSFVFSFMGVPDALLFAIRIGSYLLFLIVCVGFVLKLVRWLINHFFFKVRNRIIAGYVLTGILPIVLLILLVYIGFNLFMLQLVSFHVKHVLEEELAGLGAISYKFAFGLVSGSESGLIEYAGQLYPQCSRDYPGLQVMIWRVQSEPELLWGSTGATLPFIELSDMDRQIYFQYEDTIYLLSSIKKAGSIGNVVVISAVPLERPYLDKIEHFFDGRIMFVSGGVVQTEPSSEDSFSVHISSTPELTEKNDETLINSPQLQEKVARWSETVPHGLDYFTSYTYAEGLGLSPEGIDAIGIIGIINTRYSYIVRTFIQGAIPDQIPIQNVFITALIIIGILFGAIELIALIISVLLSRSITKLIGQLHRKTQYISAGDLTGYQIASSRRDQLGELAHSFDRMSEDLEAMLIKVKEKERLEHELAIAQQVQKMFFPKQLPQVSGLELLGKCVPAQMVSGDYYDFISHKEGYLDFFIGDISGKGISAALLMASSHTFLRNESNNHLESDVSLIVQRFNEHLVTYAAETKFSTLFYGRLELETRALHYCNAGHLPPLIFRDKEAIPLTEGGMVTGLFSDRTYEQGRIQLVTGDLFAAYTDGFSETINLAQEEFGDERLAALFSEYSATGLDNIYAKVIDTIHNWAAEQQQHDDMTMVLVKVH
ncbi:SpoIIE family protein phosphatase [bacterium]|nr:SpoIIE family protein phosphatase [bacterium]